MSNPTDSNGNGKRERPTDAEKDEDAPNSKTLKSSGSESEKEDEQADKSEAQQDQFADPEETEVNPDSQEEVKPSSVKPVAPEVTAKEEVDPLHCAFQVDRAGKQEEEASSYPEMNQTSDPMSNPGVEPAAEEKTDPHPSDAAVKAAAAATATTAKYGAPAVAPAPALPPAADPYEAATVSNPDQIVEERGEVSALYVGRVIGKGGEMIRDLQARSGARIDVDQNVPAGQPRVITYRGTRQTVDFAKHLVELLKQNVPENDLPLGNARQEILVIPSQTVGKVIGRGGEMIRELQSKSQGKIQVDHSGRSGLPPDQKQVMITGTDESVTKAKEMVLFLVANPMMDAQQALNMLIDDKLQGNKWGSGPPYVNLPNQGSNMQPHMVPPQYHQMSQGYGTYQQLQQPYGSAYYPQQQLPSQQPYGAPQVAYPPQQQHQYGAPFGGKETDVIFAQKQYMGRIIGGKGITINDLQRRSGTNIQINQEVQVGQNCEITITGPRASIEAAKAMIQEIIDVGPNHQYAGGGGGGMDSGGGGGGYPSYNAPSGYSYQQQQPYDQHGGGGYGSSYMQPAQGHYGGSAPMGGGYGHHQQQPYGGGGGGYAPPPSAWKTATAPDGQVYYYNELTGETQWDKPAGMP